MGYARSEKNFFDKQSEIWQKISSSKKYTDMRMKVDFSKTLNFRGTDTYMEHLCVFLWDFQTFVFFV